MLAATACSACLAAATVIDAAQGYRGVYFNPQLNADPNYPWLLNYPACRSKIQIALQELHSRAGVNLVDVFVMIPNTLKQPAHGNRPGEPLEAWANTDFLDNVCTFIEDCHAERIQAALDLADNRWVPASVDPTHHIGAPNSKWWPTADPEPWKASAEWYAQVINYVERHLRHPQNIAYWCMMGNYVHGAAEPLLWDSVEPNELIIWTERFVKAVWPAFYRAGKRPKAAPIMLPILSNSSYWRTKSVADRLSGVYNLQRWLVQDLRLPPSYWIMTTYPNCDPAPDGTYYIREILSIIGKRNAGRLLSTDLKGIGHEAELRDSIIGDTHQSGAEMLQWHLKKCRQYGLAGWWMWAYQDTPTETWGLRTVDGNWKNDLLDVLKQTGTPEPAAGR